jgi:hypothetical protein
MISTAIKETDQENEIAEVSCPSPGCRWSGNPQKLIKGVCPRCAAAFKSRHAAILREDYDPWKDPGHKTNGVENAREVFFDEESLKVMTTDDTSTAEGWLNWYCHEFAVDMATAQEQGAAWANHFGENKGIGGLQQARELFQRMNAGTAWLIEYSGDMRMAARCLAFRLGFKDVAGCGKGTAVELARACSTDKHAVSKQTANKCIMACEEYLNGLPQFKPLPPMPGQRSVESRSTMSKATADGWKRKTTTTTAKIQNK